MNDIVIPYYTRIDKYKALSVTFIALVVSQHA